MSLDLELWQWTGAFAVSAVAIMAAGTVLARSGDAIATRTRLGGLFIGMLLLATATSMPEIVTDVSATLNGSPDLALGDLFGSSMANMAILATIDFVARRRLWPGIEQGHARVAAVGIALTAIIVLGVVSPTGLRIGWLGIEPILVVGIYVAAASWIGRVNRVAVDDRPPTGEELLAPTGWGTRPRSLRGEFVIFGVAAIVILVSGPALAVSAQAIAEQTGIGETFIGVTLLAVATSLPELVASLAAIRIGAYDLAVGNLFGSNAFNMTVVLWMDVAHLDGPVLDAVSTHQVVPGLDAILLMALATAGILGGGRRRLRRGEPDAALLLLAYVGLLVLAYFRTG